MQLFWTLKKRRQASGGFDLPRCRESSRIGAAAYIGRGRFWTSLGGAVCPGGGWDLKVNKVMVANVEGLLARCDGKKLRRDEK